MCEVRKFELKEKYEQANAKAGQIVNTPEAINKRLAEVDQCMEFVDAELDGISLAAANMLLQETMTSADFPYAITSYVNRLAIPGYQRKRFDFEPLVWNDTLQNFLPHNRYQHRDSLDDLELVVQKGRARPGSKDDATPRIYQVYRWEKQFDFSWEALQNDDLAYFSDQAMLMGEAARRTLEKFVSRMYTNAVSILRLTNLGALFSQNGRLTSTRVSEARMAFNQRVDSRNEPINARCAFIVHHSGLMDTANQILNSELVPELAVNGINVVRNNFIPIEDPYITGTAPNLPWWAFTDWRENNVRPFVLARMEGWPGPRVLRKKSDIEVVSSMLGAGAAVDPILGDFDSGDIVVKIVDIFGTYTDATEGEYFDYRGGYYSSGTAP